MSTEIVVILPERAEDALSSGLRQLTEEMIKRGLCEPMWAGLAGPTGYGADYENDTFMMHQYCWCEEDDCPWCSWENADRGALNFWHKPSGLKVWWYKWIGRSQEYSREVTEGQAKLIIADCIASLPEPSA